MEKLNSQLKELELLNTELGLLLDDMGCEIKKLDMDKVNKLDYVEFLKKFKEVIKKI